MSVDDLIGTWRLVSYEARSPDGSVMYPLGPEACGYIMYNPDGYMAVSMMSANREDYASSDLKGGTDEEKLAAAGTYISYCGRFEVKGDRVFHQIEVAFFPNRVGTAQERIFELTGDSLDISTPPMLIEGEQRTAHLSWRRVEQG